MLVENVYRLLETTREEAGEIIQFLMSYHKITKKELLKEVDFED